MHFFRRLGGGAGFFSIVAACLWLATPLVAQLMPGADAKWRYYQSENFEMYSRNSDGDSRLLLRNLELVHAIFFETFQFKPVRKVPVTVYFFSRDKHFVNYKPEEYKKLENIASIYSSTWDRGILMIAPLPTYEAAQKLAFGGYSHHLFRLIDFQPPVWYGYGVSGIMRNIELGSTTFDLGKADDNQVRQLAQSNLIPVEVMLGADHQSNVYLSNKTNNLFHNESWALVHYLYFGQHKLPQQNVAAFVNYTLMHSKNYDAVATRTQFEQNLGFDYKAMDQRLDSYFRGGRYSWGKRPLPPTAPTKSYLMRAVSVAEINTRLGELALRVNRSPQGKLTVLQALDTSPESARLNEALGSDAYIDGDVDVSVDRWERAIAAGSKNPAVLHELVSIEKRRRFQRFDLYYRLPEETLEKLRVLCESLIAVEPDGAESYELLAWVEATAPTPSIKNLNRVQQKFEGLRDKDKTLLALAVVRLRLGDKPAAAEILDLLESRNPNDWVKYGIEYTRASIEERAVDRENLPKSEGGIRNGPPIRLKVGRP